MNQRPKPPLKHFNMVKNTVHMIFGVWHQKLQRIPLIASPSNGFASSPTRFLQKLMSCSKNNIFSFIYTKGTEF